MMLSKLLVAAGEVMLVQVDGQAGMPGQLQQLFPSIWHSAAEHRHVRDLASFMC